MSNYKDLNILFQLGEGDLIITDKDVINQSIANILGTRKGTRVFNRSFGSNISDMLFENMTPDIINDFQLSIFQALSEYEPRIEITFNDISVVALEDENFVQLNISYKIVGTSQVETFSDII